MSMAMERSNNGGGFVNHRSIYNAIEFADRKAAEEEDRSGSLSSSESSSIGNNSDDEDDSSAGGDEEEVESEFKGGPLDSLDALEEVLPVKKSISKFYTGKSKSFTSLSDAVSCSSIEDIRKPDNAYTRKRKNLLAFNMFLDKNRGGIPRSSGHAISKRPTSCRSMLSLAAAANCSESNSGDTSNSNSSSPGSYLPPLPPQARMALQNERSSSPPINKFPSFRAFSLSDLQGAAATAAAAAAAPRDTGLWTIRDT